MVRDYKLFQLKYNLIIILALRLYIFYLTYNLSYYNYHYQIFLTSLNSSLDNYLPNLLYSEIFILEGFFLLYTIKYKIYFLK